MADDRGGDGSDFDELGDDEKLGRKRARVEREKAELVRSVAADDFSTLKNRVAAVLNLVPRARDSDIVLCLRYWEMFQADIYNPKGILPSDLFKLERLHYLVRARAMIQNDYGLFVASEAVRNRRRQNEEIVKSEVLTESADIPLVKVFADETGKTGRYVMVAAVWVLSGYARFRLTKAIDEWRIASGFGRREMHFSSLGKADSNHLEDFLGIVARHSEFLSFKVIGIERAKTRRPITELVARLHEYMIKRGVEHELSTGRITLPRTLEFTIDEEDSFDELAIADLKHAIEAYFGGRYPVGSVTVGEVKKANSRNSALLQLADLIAGAVNRLRNHDGDRNYKDVYAERIADAFGLDIDLRGDEDFDSAAELPLS